MCDHIRLPVRCRVRQGTTYRMDISPPPLPPPTPPPIPAGGLEYRLMFSNSKRRLAWPRVPCKIYTMHPGFFSCLLTLHQQDLFLSHFRQLLSHDRPLGLIRCPLELLLVLLNVGSELLKLVGGLHSTTARAICWANASTECTRTHVDQCLWFPSVANPQRIHLHRSDFTLC